MEFMQGQYYGGQPEKDAGIYFMMLYSTKGRRSYEDEEPQEDVMSFFYVKEQEERINA
jgi:hypothetical protein